jgi:hypothetical protein
LRCHFGNFHLEAPASPVWTSHHIKVRTWSRSCSRSRPTMPSSCF